MIQLPKEQYLRTWKQLVLSFKSGFHIRFRNSFPEVEFLVMMGTSSFLAGHDVQIGKQLEMSCLDENELVSLVPSNTKNLVTELNCVIGVNNDSSLLLFIETKLKAIQNNMLHWRGGQLSVTYNFCFKEILFLMLLEVKIHVSERVRKTLFPNYVSKP